MPGGAETLLHVSVADDECGECLALAGAAEGGQHALTCLLHNAHCTLRPGVHALSSYHMWILFPDVRWHRVRILRLNMPAQHYYPSLKQRTPVGLMRKDWVFTLLVLMPIAGRRTCLVRGMAMMWVQSLQVGSEAECVRGCRCCRS